MRKPVMAANWKMHKTVSQAADFTRDFVNRLDEIKNQDCEVIICPPFIALSTLAELLEGSNVYLGAQNMHWEDEGAYTGEISPGMLSQVGCRCVILGHSERRQYFQEKDEDVNRKVLTAFRYNLTPIVCVGEVLEERKAKNTEQVIRRQVEKGLGGLTAAQVHELVVAYEPVWAIGTGHTSSPEDAQQVNTFIRKVLEEMFGKNAAGAVRIQYGGSVKPGNAADLMSQQDIDGALVGGASLDAASFASIVEAAG
ncbi:MAG: triose-phosphate isomerase [Clostridiales bacterium]|nr:triose-phosphate isomerase [Clostridiales bacterium]MCF8021626.1 triose-phosphate isomerase [Clostridiales bacterium]